MTRTTPLRLITLHLGHIFFTEALTFMTRTFYSYIPGEEVLELSTQGPSSVIAIECSK
jgi:hypothetical protein